jgi:hypothetical protein
MRTAVVCNYGGARRLTSVSSEALAWCFFLQVVINVKKIGTINYFVSPPLKRITGYMIATQMYLPTFLPA